MHTFIEGVLSEINKKGGVHSNNIFILPSKRAVTFLKKAMVEQTNATYFAPKIISIEEFIEEISGLKIVDSLTVLLSSYSVYLDTEAFKEKESFEEYASWAPALLNDFNEIDRYLVPKTDFFAYLQSIQTLEKWGVKKEQTPFVKKYLSFWENLNAFYDNLNHSFQKSHKGYQGMVYRKAAEDIEHYIATHGKKAHYFLGFNALNRAEQAIIQELLEQGNSTVFWDIDSKLVKDQEHAASVFIRNYKEHWNYYKKEPLTIIENHSYSRKITLAETENDIAQVKYVGQLLATYNEDTLNKTALILADESLLVPLLYSLPQNLKNCNITMGVPIDKLPEISFFEYFFDFQIHPAPFYYKKIEALLLHPWAAILFKSPQEILKKIQSQNISSLSYQKLVELSGPNNEEILGFLFKYPTENTDDILKNLREILKKISLSKNLKRIEKEVLKKIESIVKRIAMLSKQFEYIKTPTTFRSIFFQLISAETLDFEGDPTQGLQIMGILETRVLDFENIIVLSVNEGALPSGKSNNSFITFDLKLQFGLPLPPDKDAVYAYHFFHLLFRAKQGTFIYSSQSKGIHSGEKSRFLLQLEIEKNPNNEITHEFPSSMLLSQPKKPKSIEKTAAVISTLNHWAKNGISPSALLLYIRNPIDFYAEKVLGIDKIDSVEETLAYTTLGTIVHESLENLYRPFINTKLTVASLLISNENVAVEVTHQFKKHFKQGNFSTGKNRIIFEIAKRYVENLIQHDIQEIEAGNTIELIALEEKLNIPLSISELPFPMISKGTVDRIDLYNGQMRIIDYKTGKVEQKDLDVVTWEALSQEYRYSKAFQVLTYAYMYYKQYGLENSIAGIISFKNLSAGFMSFRKKEATRGTSSNTIIGIDVLDHYESQLKIILQDIFNPNVPFTEKEI